MKVVCIDSRRTEGKLIYGEVYEAEIHHINSKLLIVNGICFQRTRFAGIEKPLEEYSIQELRYAIYELENEMHRRNMYTSFNSHPCGEVNLKGERVK